MPFAQLAAALGRARPQRGPSVMGANGGWVPPDNPDAVNDPMQLAQGPQGTLGQLYANSQQPPPQMQMARGGDMNMGILQGVEQPPPPQMAMGVEPPQRPLPFGGRPAMGRPVMGRPVSRQRPMLSDLMRQRQGQI